MSTQHSKELHPMARNLFWDFTRGIAIILMLLGHALQYGMGEEYLMSEAYYANPLFKFIYGCHMPLFAVVSGYFFWGTVSRHPLPQLLRKTVLQLFVPIVCFALLYHLSHTPPPSSISALTSYFVEATLRITKSLWFLWAIMYCSIVMSISRRYKIDRWWIQLLLLAIMYCLRDSAMTGGFKFLYPFFAFGYFINKAKEEGWLTHIQSLNSWQWALLAMMATMAYTITMTCLYGYDTYFYTTQIYIFRTATPLYQLSQDAVRLLAGFTGCIAAVAFLQSLRNHLNALPLYKTITHIGRESKGIYCFQSLIVTDLSLEVLLPWPWLSVTAFVLILLAFSFTVTVCVSRVRWLRFILGKRK